MFLVQSSIIFIIHNWGTRGLFCSFCFYSFFSHSHGKVLWNRILKFFFPDSFGSYAKFVCFNVQTSISWLFLLWLGYLHTTKTSRLGSNREKGWRQPQRRWRCRNWGAIHQSALQKKKKSSKEFWSTCGLVSVGFVVPHPRPHPKEVAITKYSQTTTVRMYLCT
jgi:hypothetical protein